MCGRFLRGVDKDTDGISTYRDPDSADRVDKYGNVVGNVIGSVQDDIIIEHNHEFSLPANHVDDGDGAGYMFINTSKIALESKGHTTTFTGGSESRPKNVNVYWIIYTGVIK